MESSQMLSYGLAALAYGAVAVFLYGFIKKVVGYAKTPSPVKIPTTPAPLNSGGAAMRVLGEVVFFNSLFKGNKATWIGGVVFHWAFLFVVIRHLRYFLYPVPGWNLNYFQDLGIYAGIVLPVAVLYLFMRRMTVDRTVFISSLADYFILALIFCIAITGILMKYYVRPFMVDVKGFVYGLVTLNPSNVPMEPVFILHFLLVCTLLVYFPYSKLMHAGGVWFSPTRFMVDNPREKRHVNPWSPNLTL